MTSSHLLTTEASKSIQRLLPRRSDEKHILDVISAMQKGWCLKTNRWLKINLYTVDICNIISMSKTKGMYVYVCVCIGMDLYVYVYVVHLHVHVYVRTYVRTYIHTYLRTHVGR